MCCQMNFLEPLRRTRGALQLQCVSEYSDPRPHPPDAELVPLGISVQRLVYYGELTTEKFIGWFSTSYVCVFPHPDNLPNSIARAAWGRRPRTLPNPRSVA